METLLEPTLQQTNNTVVIKTPILQDAISKAVKACSMDNAFPLTSMLQIVVKEGRLTVQATDNVNTLYIHRSDVSGDIDFVVDAKLFSGLVSRITTPMTELYIEGTNLKVKANGIYDIALMLEQDGSKTEIPNYEFPSTAKNHISNIQLRNIITANKSCKTEMKEIPSLYNYYMDNEKVLTADNYKACCTPIKVFDTAVCLPPELVELISLIADDNGVDAQESGDSVLFSSSKGCLYGKKSVQEDLEQYPVQEIVTMMNDSFNYECLLNRTLLINTLDRLCLFTDGYENNAVQVCFEAEKVTFTANESGTHESVKYLQPCNADSSFNILVDGAFLKQQLSALPQEDIKVKFGNENGIQIICDGITQFASTLEDEDYEDEVNE